MEFDTRDWDFAANVKMFAVGLQGVYFDTMFGGLTGKGRAAAGIWAWLAQEEIAKLKRIGKVTESWYQIRKRLMKKVEEKLVQRDYDDLLTILSA